AEMLFPIDRMKNVNRGRLELRTFDPDKDLAAAEAAAASARGGRDPFAGRTGDFKRHYLLASANEILPYRMYVPTTYNGSKAFPLIVALHGLGGTEDAFFESYNKVLPHVRQQSKIDDGRIYLMGHSMGGIGTWKIAPKFPDIWAAIAPISGNGAPDTLERIRSVPEIIVHGDADPTVNVAGSRTMVAKQKELGVEHK